MEVAAAAPSSPRLLGVRDGFRAFFEHRLPSVPTVVVVPQEAAGEEPVLPLSDEESIGLIRRKAEALHQRLQETYLFYVAAEGGLDVVEVDGRLRYFVRTWCAVSSDLGAALGSSSAVELPPRLIEGLGGEAALPPHAFPGTRRSGGMLKALTAGLDDPRRAVATATFNALSTLFYGILGNGSAPARFVPPRT